MLFEFDGHRPGVGRGTYVSETAQVIGDVIIGDNCYVGHGAILHGNAVGDFSVIGMGAILSIFSETGEWTIVGEGAVVRANQKIPGRVVAVGNPAVVIREISDRDRELWTYGKQVYLDLAQKCLEQSMKRIG